MTESPVIDMDECSSRQELAVVLMTCTYHANRLGVASFDQNSGEVCLVCFLVYGISVGRQSSSCRAVYDAGACAGVNGGE